MQQDLTLRLPQDGGEVLYQFYKLRCELEPEKKIVAAQFDRAIAESDHDWVNEPDSTFIHGFEWCCDVFGFSVSSARQWIVKQMVETSHDTVVDRRKVRHTLAIIDLPGETYTHAFAACENWGKCEECQPRYQAAYSPVALRSRRQLVRRKKERV